jgi:hypothetical protein
MTWEQFKQILEKQEAKIRKRDLECGKTPEIRARIQAEWAAYDAAKRTSFTH